MKYFERLGEEFGLILTNISVNFPCIQNQTCLHFFQHATFYVVSHPCTKLTTYLLIFSVVSFPRSDQFMFPSWLYLPRKVDQRAQKGSYSPSSIVRFKSGNDVCLKQIFHILVCLCVGHCQLITGSVLFVPTDHGN